MIYVVTNNHTLNLSSQFTKISVERSLELLEPLRVVGLDTETTGLSC